MDLHEVLARTGEMLLGRTTGPLTLRLILQPSMAALFAIRAAIKDTRDGHSEFFLRGCSITRSEAKCCERRRRTSARYS